MEAILIWNPSSHNIGLVRIKRWLATPEAKEFKEQIWEDVNIERPLIPGTQDQWWTKADLLFAGEPVERFAMVPKGQGRRLQHNRRDLLAHRLWLDGPHGLKMRLPRLTDLYTLVFPGKPNDEGASWNPVSYDDTVTLKSMMPGRVKLTRTVHWDQWEFDERWEAALSLAAHNRRYWREADPRNPNVQAFLKGNATTKNLIYALFVKDIPGPFLDTQVYIGKTTRTLRERMKEHLREHQTLADLKLHQVCLWADVVCVVLDIAPGPKELGNLEKRYIGLFSSFGRAGLNMDPGQKK